MRTTIWFAKCPSTSKEVPDGDLHRRQITFDALEADSGEVWRGEGVATRPRAVSPLLRNDLTQRANGGPVALAVEGCTGWRYVVEEIEAAGPEAHLAEPADTQAARGRKRHAKTDRSDARLLRELLAAGDPFSCAFRSHPLA